MYIFLPFVNNLIISEKDVIRLKKFSVSKKLLISLMLGLSFALSMCVYASFVQKDISRNVIRLHIIANSDTDYDQQVKLLVRNSVNEYLSPLLKNSKSIEESEKIIKSSLNNINAVANQTLKASNVPYTASTCLGTRSFPTRQYENITLPSGTYKALCIDLGAAQGKNWWCVMFPPLCFNNSTVSMDDSCKEYLKNHLNADSFSLVNTKEENSSSFPVTYRFKIFDCLNSVNNFFQKH